MRVDRARAAANPPMPNAVVAISAPPATIRSTVPYWIMRIPSAMLWAPVLQAETMEMFGPFRPNMIDRLPATMLMMLDGTKNGEMRRGPVCR